MKASVVIPCHNAGRWIAAALRSVAQQSYPAFEIIVVDDSSSDNTLAEVGASGVGVKLLRVQTRNAAAARNAGIEAAGGDWIALLDADDVWYPNHLARAAELLEGTEDVAFMTNHDWIGLDNEFLPIPKEFQCRLTEPRTGMDIEDFFHLTDNGFHFGHSTVLYRTDRLRAVGMFDPTQRRRHDIDLWIRMTVGRTWTYDTIKSVAYRENTPGSLSKDEAECDYFYLRALVRNLSSARGEAYLSHLARQARRAMGIAFVDGPPQHYAAIRDLAWPHLATKYRAFYRCASAWPALSRGLMRARRRMLRHDVPIATSSSPASQ